MKTRVLTGMAIVAPAVYLIGWSPKWLYMAALVLLVERGLYEYFVIVEHSGLATLPGVGYAGGAAVCLAQWAGLERPRSRIELALLTFLTLLILLAAVRAFEDLRQYLSGVATTLMGVLYVALSFSWLFPLRFSNLGSGLANGRQIVFFLFAVICVGDIFAYLTGRTAGRRSIFPRVSPKKTFEGALGGLVASVIVGWVYAHFFWYRSEWKVVLPLAFSVAVAGQIGDLVESAMKRGANLKDSGSLLPGHGGLLDRVDSMLFGVPVLWLALVLRNSVH